MAVRWLETTEENLGEVLGTLLARPSDVPAGAVKVIDLERWVGGIVKIQFECPDTERWEAAMRCRIEVLEHVGVRAILR